MVLFNDFGQGYFYFTDLDSSVAFDNAAGKMEFLGSKKRLPIAKGLTGIEYNILCETNMIHQRAHVLSDPTKYSLSHLTKVSSYVSDMIIKVYFECGDCFYYTNIGAVYKCFNDQKGGFYNGSSAKKYKI